MANMTNIKTKTYILGLSAAIMLCGCGNVGDEQPNINTETSSSIIAVYTSITEKNTETTEITKPAEITETTEATTVTEMTTVTEATTVTEETPNVTDNVSAEIEILECPDDEIVPAEWLPVCYFLDAVQNFDDIVSADVSKMDTADAIIALANKNVIFMNTFVSDIFCNADIDHPYYSENYKNPNYPDKPIYPITLNYFTDIQEIYDLGSETYTDNALEDFYASGGKVSRRCFMKENGVSYIDLWATPIWDSRPFEVRTYIEILEETENKCSFIWHVPNWTIYALSPELAASKPRTAGYYYFYYNYHTEAEYINGSWKLTEVRHDGFMK